MGKTVIYIRQSLGNDKQKLSSDTQLKFCSDLAKEKGFLVWKVYSDYNVSGRTTEIKERLQLYELLQEIKLGKIGRVITYKRDRLSRNAHQYSEIMNDYINKYNVEVLFAASNEPPAFKGNVGEFLELILGGVSQYEGDNINKKLLDSRKAKLRTGQEKNVLYWAGGTAPFGFKVKEGVLVPCPQNQKTVEKAFRIFEENLFEDGSLIHSISQVAKSLNIADSTLKRIIRSEFHMGKVKQVVDGEEFISELEKPAVGIESWQLANQNLTLYEKKQFEKSPLPTLYLLYFIQCGYCETKMYNPERSVFYRCSNHKKLHFCNAHELELEVFSALKKHITEQLKIYQERIQEAVINKFKAEVLRRVDEVKQSITNADSEIKRLGEQSLAHSSNKITQKLQKTFSKLRDLESSLSDLDRKKLEIEGWDKLSPTLNVEDAYSFDPVMEAYLSWIKIIYWTKEGLQYEFHFLGDE
ncbi:recombinase family protein [Alteribacter keqinensis]|uniref:recombinase family protein n=1 Tax=Alteribacter keqinensis TaxID=2483800 RepID=UPI0016065130|nr:recombinase family protein [Alteribacter keqinensis]